MDAGDVCKCAGAGRGGVCAEDLGFVFVAWRANLILFCPSYFKIEDTVA